MGFPNVLLWSGGGDEVEVLSKLEVCINKLFMDVVTKLSFK